MVNFAVRLFGCVCVSVYVDTHCLDNRRRPELMLRQCRPSIVVVKVDGVLWVVEFFFVCCCSFVEYPEVVLTTIVWNGVWVRIVCLSQEGKHSSE